MNRIRSHLTYANVVATLSLFLVLGGGTALASYVVSSNSQVRPGTISGHNPPSGDQANIIGGSVNGADLAASSVSNGKLGNGSISLGKLAKNSVNSSKVLDGSLIGGDHANNTIPGSKLETFPAASVSQPAQEIGSQICDVESCPVANDDETQLCWFNTVFDTDGLAQDESCIGNFPDHLTAPIVGTYVVGGQFSWNANGTGDRRITLYQADSSGNNSQQIGVDQVQPVTASGEWTQQNVGAIVRLNAGDQVSMSAYQQSGGTLNGEGGSLQMAWIGP